MKKLLFAVLGISLLGLSGCAALRDYAKYKAEMDAKCASSCCCHCAEREQAPVSPRRPD